MVFILASFSDDGVSFLRQKKQRVKNEMFKWLRNRIIIKSKISRKWKCKMKRIKRWILFFFSNLNVLFSLVLLYYPYPFLICFCLLNFNTQIRTDLYRFQIHPHTSNPNNYNVYVNILYINSNMNVSMLQFYEEENKKKYNVRKIEMRSYLHFYYSDFNPFQKI